MREQLPLESTNQLTTTFFEKIFVSCVVFLAWNCLASAAAPPQRWSEKSCLLTVLEYYSPRTIQL
jgi:hypothetical protein